MSDAPSQYPSRLQRHTGEPVRGIGSAYAENQKLAGAAAAEEAARVASKPDSARIEEAEKASKSSDEFDAMCEDVTIAVTEGVYRPSALPKGTKEYRDIVEWVRTQPLDAITEMHKAAQEAYDAQVEREDAQILRTQIQNIGMVDPADPLYDPLTDAARRKRIEKDLPEIDFAEMMFRGSTTQTVHIRKDFNVTFRTLSTQHGLWLEWMMAQSPETSVQHTRHTFSLMMLAATLDAINGKEIGTSIAALHKDNIETRDLFVKALQTRLEALGRLPSLLSDDLIIQSVWFQGRVRRSIAGDLMRKVGNS